MTNPTYDQVSDEYERQVGTTLRNVFESEQPYQNTRLDGYVISSARVVVVDWENFSIMAHGLNSFIDINVFKDHKKVSSLFIPVRLVLLAQTGDFNEDVELHQGFTCTWHDDCAIFQVRGAKSGTTLLRDEVDYLCSKLEILRNYEPFTN